MIFLYPWLFFRSMFLRLLGFGHLVASFWVSLTAVLRQKSIFSVWQWGSIILLGVSLSVVGYMLWTLTWDFRELMTVFLPLFETLFYGFIYFFSRYSLISFTTAFYFYLVSVLFLTAYGFSVVWFYWETLQVVHLTGLKWLEVGNLDLHFGFLFDGVTINMIFVVLFISALVKIYSMGYMQHDPHQFRFFSYLSFFTFFMLVLITADNFVQLFLGWEGVGLCSYLLISFWSTRLQAVKSALKAIVINRIADCGLLFAMGLMYAEYQSFDYATVFALVPHVVASDSFYTNWIAFFLLVGAAGKSAQFGLHMWLPDAMEGPTPVSALIHAATMVTAGVFLIVRCSPLFEYSAVLPLMAFWGGFTAFFAATIALFQYDMKKIIAYSTCSQLGYMFFACGTSNYYGAMYHLTTHAFFKALLFLAAGAVIHSFSDEQDIRKFGGVAQLLPLVYTVFLIGSFALMGFPFFSGFYSKEFILQYAYVRGFYISFWFANIAALFTIIYSLKLLYFVFFNTDQSMPSSFGVAKLHCQTNMSKNMYRNFHEPSWFMLAPLILLAFSSIFSGYLLSDIYIGFDSFFFGNSILVRPEHSLGIAVEAKMPLVIKLLPLVYLFLSLLGLLFYMMAKRGRFSGIMECLTLFKG